MKKIFTYIFIFLLCFTLVGCSSSNIEEEESNADNQTEESDEDLQIISTDNELVFMNEDGYYMIFEYNNSGELQTVRWILPYDTVDQAETVYNMYAEGDYASMFDVEREGKIVTLSYKEEYAQQLYSGISKSDMEEVMEDSGYEIKK